MSTPKKSGTDRPFIKRLVTSMHLNASSEEKSQDDLPTHKLLHTQRRAYELKNFNEEIYAIKHIKEFLDREEHHDQGNSTTIGDEETGQNHANSDGDQSSSSGNTTILFEKLDLTQKFLFSSLLNKLLTKMLASDKNINESKINEILLNMFSKIEGEDEDICDENIYNKNLRVMEAQDVNLLADTLQGYTHEAANSKRKSSVNDTRNNHHIQGNNQHDTFNHEWLCIMTDSKHLKETKLGILKLDKPLKLGDQANNVRLIFLIAGSSNTDPRNMHSPIEIAKTFGTLLKNPKFIHQLMDSKSVEHFKSQLIVEAGNRERIQRLMSRKHNTHGGGHHGGDHHGHHAQHDKNSSDADANSSPTSKKSSSSSKHDHHSHAIDNISKRQKMHRKMSRILTASTDVSAVGSHRNSSSRPALSKIDSVFEELPMKRTFFGCKAKHHQPHATMFSQKPSQIGRGIIQDIKNRYPFYFEDWFNAFYTYEGKDASRKFKYIPGSLPKILKAINFVLISVLLPTLAFGNANSSNTCAKINVERTIFGQFLAGIVFSCLSSQPLGLVMTTPPITLLIKFVYKMATKELEEDFFQFYAMTGTFIGVNLILFSLFNMSVFLRKITPSIEEIFAIFAAYAFFNEVLTTMENINDEWSKDPKKCSLSSLNKSSCYRDRLFLWYLLMLGTFFVAFVTYSVFKKTSFLNRKIRNFLADYSLITAVIVFSCVYNLRYEDVDFKPYVLEFNDIFKGGHPKDNYDKNYKQIFNVNDNVTCLNENSTASFTQIIQADLYKSAKAKKCKYGLETHTIQFEDVTQLKGKSIAVAWAISIPLSILFFLDQGFCSIVTNAPKNKLQKPGGYHLDLFLVGLRGVPSY